MARSFYMILFFFILAMPNLAHATGGGGGGGGGGGSSVPTLHFPLQVLFILVIALMYRKKK